MWEQLPWSLPATHLYGTVAERWCWQHCSGEARNPEERQGETEPDGSGRGHALHGPSPVWPVWQLQRNLSYETPALWALPVPNPADHLLKHKCLWLLLISLFLSQRWRLLKMLIKVSFFELMIWKLTIKHAEFGISVGVTHWLKKSLESWLSCTIVHCILWSTFRFFPLKTHHCASHFTNSNKHFGTLYKYNSFVSCKCFWTTPFTRRVVSLAANLFQSLKKRKERI